MALLWVVLLLAASPAMSYVQFQHTLVPLSDKAKDSILATERATIGVPAAQGFNKVARTRELHNCVLPGCTLMGEVLDIRHSNVTTYDRETLQMNKRVVKNKKGKKSKQRSVPQS